MFFAINNSESDLKQKKDGGRDGRSDGGPGLGWVGVLLVVSAGLEDDRQCINHLGEATSIV